MKLKPVHVDGSLYVGMAVFGSIQAIMQTDEVYKYMSPYAVFWTKFVSAVFLAAFGALKMFRSNTYAEHRAQQDSLGQTTDTRTVSETTTVEHKPTPPSGENPKDMPPKVDNTSA